MRTDVCMHFNGLITEQCQAGTQYEAVHHAGSLRLKDQYPCFNAALVCPARQFPTAEEVQAEKRDVAQRLLRMIRAREAIEAATGGEYGKRGTTTCPNCQGRLRYAVASSNGHVTAICSTAGCVSFIE